jgi:hypothetical protein
MEEEGAEVGVEDSDFERAQEMCGEELGITNLRRSSYVPGGCTEGFVWRVGLVCLQGLGV